MATPEPSKPVALLTWRQRIKAFYVRLKSLQGDPHYVAVGMASGVFVSVTPTIPFHMVLAVALAFVLKGSKPAAIIGAWFCNPLTIGPFYIGSYQVGMFLLGREISVDLQTTDFQELLALGADVATAMVVGGALLGIIPAILSYFFTFYMFRKIRARHARAHATASGKDRNAPGDDTPLPDTDAENTHTP